MAIVHLGCVSLQVERRDSRQAFLEELWKQMEEAVRQVVTRCIEEAYRGALQALRFAVCAGLSAGWTLPASSGHAMGALADLGTASGMRMRWEGAGTLSDLALWAAGMG